MPKKPTYGELEKQVETLMQELSRQRRIEGGLRLDAERFKNIADNAFEWIWEIDADGRFVYSSPRAKKFLGYEPDEILGRYFYEFFHPDDKEKLKKLARETFTRKMPFNKFIHRNVTGNGETIVLATRGVPILDDRGNLKGYRGADADVTFQFEAERSLRKSEEHLNSLLKSASGFAVYRLAYDESEPSKLTLNFVSPSIREILGIEPDEFSSETFFGNIHPDQVENVIDANRMAFKSNRFDEIFRYHHKRSGKWVWIHAVATGVLDEQGQVTHVNGIFIDITLQYQAVENMLATQKELMGKNKALEDSNVALRVLLNQREQIKNNLERRITENINQMVFPYVEKLEQQLNSEQKIIFNILRSNLNELTHSFSSQRYSQAYGLTYTEIKVADLIRHGSQTKEIANILNISIKTVEAHRNRIREKIGIKGKKINLRSFLNSIE